MAPWMNFLSGATAALYLVAAVVFLRFFRRTQDRLFVFFSLSFTLLAVNRVLFIVFNVPDEKRTTLYVVRLIAFILILIAIIDKNRAHPRKQVPPKS